MPAAKKPIASAAMRISIMRDSYASKGAWRPYKRSAPDRREVPSGA